jgi:hypothetical protein
MVWYKVQRAPVWSGSGVPGCPKQLEHAREPAPSVSAVGAYPSSEPSFRSPVDLEKKTDGLPRRW